VLVAIRPEDLEIERRGESRRENTLGCGVERVLYLGSECEVLLRTGDESFTLTASRAKAAEVGNQLDLHLPPEHVRVWAADEVPPSLEIEAVTPAVLRATAAQGSVAP
jgi:hypothetical protein